MENNIRLFSLNITFSVVIVKGKMKAENKERIGI